MSKHTQGPWKSEGKYIFGRSNGLPVELVASIPSYGDNLDKDSANARLIAAAPGLLAALEQLRAANRNFGADSGLNMLIEQVCSCAIARATGEQE
jgi:hypothetical protein